jgi:signal transduction histidine kinase
MSSKKDNFFFKTLVFRLTFQYIIFFTVFNVLLFLVIFLKIKSSQDNITDKNLIAKLKTAIPLSDIKDCNQLRKELSWKSAMEGAESCFYLIVDSTNTTIATSYIKPWGNIQSVKQDIPDLPKMDPLKNKMPEAWYEKDVKIQPELLFKHERGFNYVLFKSLYFYKINSKARVAYVYLPNKTILIVGVSLKENDVFLNTIERIFIFSLFVMTLFGGLLGYLISKKSMVDVVKITHAAENIRKGNLSLRVKPGSNSSEIKNLSHSFNNMLERIERLIIEQKDLTNNIAHDLRSPITSIRGISETTLSGKQSVQEYQEMCGQVINECDRLINMINSTLDIAEIEAGTFEIRMEEINANELLSDAFEMYLPVAELKGVHFEHSLPKHKIIIRGNKSLLQRAIANILDNAIKYTKSEGEVKLTGVVSDNQFIITITDTGIGIPLEEQNRIFEKFYRVDKSRSSNGNGLGLSLANAYILLHKGTIGIISKSGEGSSFAIVLPYNNLYSN